MRLLKKLQRFVQSRAFVLDTTATRSVLFNQSMPRQ